MLPVQFIRDEKARVQLSLEKRGFKDPEILDRIIAADDRSEEHTLNSSH
jgi:seryl-tRNA synthetase